MGADPTVSPFSRFTQPDCKSLDDGSTGARQAADYVRALYKRRVLAALTFIFVVTLMTARIFTQVPIYSASARLLLQQERTRLVTYATFVDDPKAGYQSHIAVIGSRAHVRKTMEVLNIFPSVKPAAASPAMQFSMTGAVNAMQQSAAAWFRQADTAAGPGCLNAVDQDAAIACFRRGLTIVPDANSGFVDVHFRSTDPATAATYANTFARTYLEEDVRLRSASTQDAVAWLTRQVDEQRRRLDESEQALQQYRERNDATGLDQNGELAIQKLSDFTTALVRAKTDRLEKEAVYSRIQSARNDVAVLADIFQIQQAPSVQRVRTAMSDAEARYATVASVLGEKHPDLIKARATTGMLEETYRTELIKAADALTAQYRAAEATEARLSESFDAQRKAALGMNRTDVDKAVLERDAASNRQIFEYLIQRQKEARIAADVKTDPVRIVDVAETPRLPLARNTKRIVSTGLATGLVFAVGLVFLLDFFDSRIKSPEEIESRLGLAYLGMVPRVASTHGCRDFTDSASAGVIEAFGSIRTSVLYATTMQNCRSIVVTSSAPKEGKTTIAVNLAISLSHAGDRVLLIDADLRRPEVHRTLKVEQKPGLSDILIGGVTDDSALRKMASGLCILPSGAIPHNPAELLGSRRFRDLMKRLSDQFDWIVIDTPPVLAVTDASVLAGLVTGIVFVVAADQTTHQVARISMQRLAKTTGCFVGGVLNRVNIQKDPYYYANYYRREYDNYYVRTAR